jgi:hypothetical protein
MRSIVLYTILLFAAPSLMFAQNQFATGRDVIENDYDGLVATYTVVINGDKSSVYVKFKNNKQSMMAIELMVTLDASPKILPMVKLPPGMTEVVNIGDIVSVTTSVAPVSSPDNKGQPVITKVVDQVTKRNGKLTSLHFKDNIKPQESARETPKLNGLSDAQARAVLELIFTKDQWAEVGPDITEEDKTMALKFLKVLLEKSCQMAVVEGIFRHQYAFDFTVVGLAKYIAESVDENCLQKNYEAVRREIALKNKGIFENRKQLGEWLQ